MIDYARPHLWQGEWLSDSEAREKISCLPSVVAEALSAPYDVRFLLDACERLSAEIANRQGEVRLLLENCLKEGFHMEEEERNYELGELAKFLSRKDLEEKLVCELGACNQFDFSRPDMRRNNFEKWSPLGFLVHIAPTNAYSAGAWSVLEGLLSGNVNFLKTGGSDELFAQLFLKCLIDQDRSQTIAKRIIACRISSAEKDTLAKILAQADGVIVWGDEGAIAGVREIAPKTARFIDWGPKISFAYFAADSLDNEDALSGLAFECCRLEQQACSSPQCVYVETEDREKLRDFANRLAAKLQTVSETIPVKKPGTQEQAEITSVVELCRLESCLGLTELIEGSDYSWRVLIEYSSVLKASPLFRTIWVKPIARALLQETLSPFRFYLQTAGLACKLESVSELSELLIQSGVLRITKVGKMLDSYSGEPHDGVFALQRYSKKVSAQLGDELDGINTFADLKAPLFRPPQVPVMSKEEFQSMVVPPALSDLFFKSGGSSGDPKLSIFTYFDYHTQMQAAAEGLFAAGFEPSKDRCMNLYFAGGLYGGFVSHFTILEKLNAVHFPMGGHPDLQMVARTIVAQKCNVLLGMPSYIIQLFSENSEVLAENQVVQKIFYGGEHFSEGQKRYLQNDFGVKLIRSGAYGSVDAGPIGYQCRCCTGTVHHLHSRLHVLEVLDLENDEPVPTGVPGRVILTSLSRAGQKIQRYDIGDLARILPGHCPCGRRGPLFELLGRHGDVFRIGSAYFNYARFLQILTDNYNYAGELQIVLSPGQVQITEPASGKSSCSRERLVLTLSEHGKLPREEQIHACVLENYTDLREIVQDEGLLDLAVEFVEATQLKRAGSSGKLRRIVDERTMTGKI